jgi:hypothetical protein
MQLIFRISPSVLVSSCLFATFAILANVISLVMIGKINERVQEGKRVSYFWWGTEVRKRFKQLYPGSRLIFLLDSCLFLMILCFVFLATRDLAFG